MTNGLAKYLPIQNDWIRCFHSASLAYTFFFFLFLFFRFCHVSCNNSFRSGLNRPLFSLVMHGSDPLSIILKKKTPPLTILSKAREKCWKKKEREKKRRDLTMYLLSIREGEGEVAGGGGGWGVGGGCRMEYALVCAGKLPVLPRCYRRKKDLRP